MANPDPGPSRFGVIVGKRVSLKATVRNRLKRQLRAVLGELLPEAKEGFLVVILTQPSALKCEYGNLRKELRDLLAKANVI